MTEGVKADDVFFLEGLEWRIFDLFPLRGLLLVGLARLLLLLLDLRLLLFPLSLLLGLLLELFRNDLVVFDGLLKRLIRQARVVNKGHGHEAAQARHALEMHVLVAHHLRDELVLKRLDDVLGLVLGVVSAALRTLRFRFDLLLVFFVITAAFFEDLVGDGCLVFIEDDVDHEFMAIAGVGELDHLGCLGVEVRCVIIVLSNLLGWEDKLAEVDTSCLGLFLDEINQLLEVVLEVGACLDRAEESLLSAAHHCGRRLVFLGLFFNCFSGLLHGFLVLFARTHGSSLTLINLSAQTSQKVRSRCIQRKNKAEGRCHSYRCCNA